MERGRRFPRSRRPPILRSDFQSFPRPARSAPTCNGSALTDIKIIYSRPSKKRHAIFGGIVSYNNLWRTGDNASTKISFSTPVKLGGTDGQEVPAGQYGLYTIPDEKVWTVILNKDAGLWGTDDYDYKKDVARFTSDAGED